MSGLSVQMLPGRVIVFRQRKLPVGNSRRVDETYVQIGSQADRWHRDPTHDKKGRLRCPGGLAFSAADRFYKLAKARARHPLPFLRPAIAIATEPQPLNWACQYGWTVFSSTVHFYRGAET